MTGRIGVPSLVRPPRMTELLARGHGTAVEILAAFHGTWPPGGLDIVDPPRGVVDLAGGGIPADARSLRGIALFARLAIHPLLRTDWAGDAVLPASAEDAATRELQAVLAEIAAAHCRHSGELPVTRRGLWRMLAAIGGKVPRRLAGPVPEPGLPPGHLASRVWLLNAAADLLPAAGREAFWRRRLVALWGDLLELYGDRHGRVRMCLPPDPARLFVIQAAAAAAGRSVLVSLPARARGLSPDLAARAMAALADRPGSHAGLRILLAEWPELARAIPPTADSAADSAPVSQAGRAGSRRDRP